jgi:hypothetical protein
MNSTPEGYKQLLVEEEGCGNPTVIFYRINLLGEIVPRFSFKIEHRKSLRRYYRKVLMEHVSDLAAQKENKHET